MWLCLDDAKGKGALCDKRFRLEGGLLYFHVCD